MYTIFDFGQCILLPILGSIQIFSHGALSPQKIHHTVGPRALFCLKSKQTPAPFLLLQMTSRTAAKGHFYVRLATSLALPPDTGPRVPLLSDTKLKVGKDRGSSLPVQWLGLGTFTAMARV